MQEILNFDESGDPRSHYKGWTSITSFLKKGIIWCELHVRKMTLKTTMMSWNLGDQ